MTPSGLPQEAWCHMLRLTVMCCPVRHGIGLLQRVEAKDYLLNHISKDFLKLVIQDVGCSLLLQGYGQATLGQKK